MMSASGAMSPMDGLSPADGNGGTNGYSGSGDPIDYGTNLWIAQAGIASNTLTGIISNSMADVLLELQTNTDLLSGSWISAGFVYGSELTNWTAWSLPMNSSSNLLVRVLATRS